MRPEADGPVRKRRSGKNTIKQTHVAASGGAGKAGPSGAIAPVDPTKRLEQLNRELELLVASRTRELDELARRLIESERARGLALAAGNMGSWEYRHATDTWTWDEGHSRIFGIDSPSGYTGTAQASRFFPEADWAHLQTLIGMATPEHNTFQTELRVQRGDGDTRHCLVSTAVSFDGARNMVRVDGVTIDITDRKEAAIRQALLAREVDHRARNTLAVVQSIVRLTTSRDIASYTDAIEGRIRALARAQELLSQSRWQGADIVRLVTEEITPYRTADAARISIAGPSVILPPDKAQATALSLHELATNAAKFGALSSGQGRVAIEWRLVAGVLTLDWKETGGPTARKPEYEGFGSKIIKASIKGQSRGDARFNWRPEGLCCTLTIPGGPDEGRTAGPVAPVAAQERLSRQCNQILLVEDEALLSLHMGGLLTDLGYGVIGPCSSVDDGIAAAKNNNLAGAILDVDLGGEFVYPLAEHLKASGIPFVFVTGYAEDRLDQRYDGVPVLQKPLTRDLLERALGSALDARPPRKLRA